MTSLLDDYQSGILGVEIGKGSAKLPQSRKEKLQAELKILEWHKMANNAAIKSALLQTKSLKASLPQKPAPQHTEDDAKWIKKVIQQEHIKPLEVAKDYVLDYESRERENADRLSNQVDRHIQTLKSLRQKLEARHDLKVRSEEYRTWQKDFLPKKQAVMIGKTLAEVEMQRQANRHAEDDADAALDAEIQDDLLKRHAHRKANNGKAPHQSSQELNTVLDSLSRLAELEQRITSLEKENKYDALLDKESLTANQRSPVEFSEHKMYPRLPNTNINGNTVNGVNPVEIRKRRAQNDRAGPMGVVYEVRTRPGGKGGDPLLGNRKNNNHQRSWQVNVPMAGSGAAAVRGKRQQFDDDDRDNFDEDNDYTERKPGVFLTAGQTSEDNFQPLTAAQRQREAQKRERLRNQHLAPAGTKALRGRVQDKRLRAKEAAIGDRKHQQAMQEMQRRKQQQTNLTKGVAAAARNTNVTVRKGAAAGVKTKNKHLQAFQADKKQFERRKDAMLHGGGNKRGGGAGGNAVASRLVSQTAPVYAAKQSNVRSSNNNNSNSNNNGRMTRRTESLPVAPRRGGAGGGAGNMGGIAVQGMGGLRVLKANQQQAQPARGRR